MKVIMDTSSGCLNNDDKICNFNIGPPPSGAVCVPQKKQIYLSSLLGDNIFLVIHVAQPREQCNCWYIGGLCTGPQ